MEIVTLLLSFLGLIITLLIARWILKINRIIRLLELNAFLNLKQAEKLDALSPDDKKFVDEVL